MDEQLIIKRLEKEVVKKLKAMSKSKINIKEFICNAIINYEIENKNLNPTI